jgi:transcriptional regulator with XRE-family HTH domain
MNRLYSLQVRHPIGYHRFVHVIDRQTGRLLRTARHRAGLSLRGAAAKADTSHATLAAYEAGRKSPTLPTLFRILGAYGFDAGIELSPRIRERDGISRRKEIEDVLALAEAFPARTPRKLTFPKFPSRRIS